MKVLSFFLLFSQALIVEEPSSEPRENNPANLVSLRTQASALRDQIHRIDKEEAAKLSAHGGGGGGGGSTRRGSSSSSSSQQQQQQQSSYGVAPPSRATEKHRKRLVELEAQLVLASPSLLFQVRDGAPTTGCTRKKN